jgi:hypothetical protein
VLILEIELIPLAVICWYAVKGSKIVELNISSTNDASCNSINLFIWTVWIYVISTNDNICVPIVVICSCKYTKSPPYAVNVKLIIAKLKK